MSSLAASWTEVGEADELLRFLKPQVLKLTDTLTIARPEDGGDWLYQGSKVEACWTAESSPMRLPDECELPWPVFMVVRFITHPGQPRSKTDPYKKYRYFFTFLRATLLSSFDPSTGVRHLLPPLEKMRGYVAPGFEVPFDPIYPRVAFIFEIMMSERAFYPPPSRPLPKHLLLDDSLGLKVEG